VDTTLGNRAKEHLKSDHQLKQFLCTSSLFLFLSRFCNQIKYTSGLINKNYFKENL
jgi:hypothetical protein